MVTDIDTSSVAMCLYAFVNKTINVCITSTLGKPRSNFNELILCWIFTGNCIENQILLIVFTDIKLKMFMQ